MPTVSTIPAMPGSVSVALNKDRMPMIIATLIATAMLAINPNSP
jgi:hypothetical protein